MVHFEGVFKPSEELLIADIIQENGLFYAEHEMKFDLYKNFGFGRIINEKLLLSCYEAEYLSLLYKLMNAPNIEGNVWQVISSDSSFIIRYAVYHYFRSKLWIVRDGTGFGFDFVLYPDHPNEAHSKYCVKIISSMDEFEKRAILTTRVTWNVKKEVMFVIVDIPSDVNIENSDCLSSITITPFTTNRETLK